MGRMKHQALARRDETLTATRIGDLLPKDIAVFCWCNRCGHNAEAATAMLISQLGPDFPVPEVGSRMRCSSCASKDVATRPAWPTRDQVVARHS